MVLDKLAETRVNIKKLVLEDPVRTQDTGFHPEKDLDEVWPIIVTHFEVDRSITPALSLRADNLSTAAIVSLLDPEKAATINLSETLLNAIVIQKLHAQYDQTQFLVDSMYLRILSPYYARQMEDNPTVKEGITRLRESRSRTDNLYADGSLSLNYVFIEAYRTKIAFPQLEDLSHLAQYIDQEIEFAKEQERAFYRTRGFVQLAHFYTSLAALKVLFPTQFTQSGLLNDQTWEMLQGCLQGFKESGKTNSFHMDIFLEMAFNMKLLAAKEIKISREKGLELIMDEPEPNFAETQTPLPERRKF